VQLGGLCWAGSWFEAVLEIGSANLVAQTRLGDPEIGGDLLQRQVGLAIASDVDDVVAALVG
jgi:hypothetical protein